MSQKDSCHPQPLRCAPSAVVRIRTVCPRGRPAWPASRGRAGRESGMGLAHGVRSTNSTKDQVMKNRFERSSFVKTALAAACAFGIALPAFGTQTLVIEPDQGLNPIYNLISSATST